MPERRERLAETDCGVNGRMPRWTEEERVASSAVRDYELSREKAVELWYVCETVEQNATFTPNRVEA